MSWMHRSCTDQIRSLEGELREAHRREVDHTLAFADLRSARDRMESERWDAAGEAELLKEKLAAAKKREEELDFQVWQLQCQVNDLEQDADDRRVVLEARRRRAAELAFGDAWHHPASEQMTHRAAVVQAILALPLEAFDVQVTYNPAYQAWYVDSQRFASFSLPKKVPELLQQRYGLTEEELKEIRRQALDADREHDVADMTVVIGPHP